jgi:DNA recombination protein RmuC
MHMPPLPIVPPDLVWPLFAACLAGGLVLGLLAGMLLGARGGARRERAALAERDHQREALADTRASLAAAKANAERVPNLEWELDSLRDRAAALTAEKTRLEETLHQTERAHAEKVAGLTALRDDIEIRMKALADAALRQSQSSLIEVARQLLDSHREAAATDQDKRATAIDGLLKPVAVKLEEYQAKLAALEKATAERYGNIENELRSVVLGQESVRGEAARLVNALRAAPKTRGRWGEQQLRNVMELAGMSEHVDFALEFSVTGENGRQRPDAIIRLPLDRCIVIDAKTSLSAYLEALDLVDEAAREAKLVEHARQIKQHVTLLAQREYWTQFETAPDFVAMFVPGENFYSAALERDPELFNYAIQRRVLIVTPTTLIALAKSVAHGWGQVRVAENARDIARLGNELYKRLITMAEPIATLGRNLDAAAGSYNQFLGSLESRVLPAARRLYELTPGESPKAMPEPKQVETALREPRRSGDLLPAAPGTEVN